MPSLRSLAVFVASLVVTSPALAQRIPVVDEPPVDGSGVTAAPPAPPQAETVIPPAPPSYAPVPEYAQPAQPSLYALPPPYSRYGISYPEAQLELAAIDARTRVVRHQRPGLGGPIVLTLIGGGTVLASFSAILEKLALEAVFAGGVNKPSPVVLTTAAIGVATLAGGVVWMVLRMRARRPYKRELRALQNRRRQLLQLLQGVRYAVVADGRDYRVSLGLRF